MDYSILKYKPKIELKDAKENTGKSKCLDLLGSKFKPSFNIQNIYIVEDYYVARPDLISLALYKTDEYADIICKINGISNPFELEKGTVLIIPDIENVNYMANYRNNQASEIVKDDEEIGKKITSLQKKKSERRSSNEQIIGDSNFILDKTNNMIFY